MKPNANLLQELNELSPILAKREKKNSFTVPENYFENFSDEINSIVKTENEGEILPDIILSSSKNVFEVPENYFESFPRQILEAAKSADENKIVKLEVKEFERREFRKILVSFSVAASLIFVFNVINHQPEQLNKHVEAKDFLANVSQEEINAYVNENLLDDEIQMVAEGANIPAEAFQKITPITRVKMDSIITILPSEQDILMNISADDIGL